MEKMVDRKINEYTRYLSIVLAIIEGVAMVIGFRNQNILRDRLCTFDAGCCCYDSRCSIHDVAR